MSPFEGLAGWLQRNRSPLLWTEAAGIALILLLIPFLPRPISGRADIYLAGLDEHTKNQFRTQIRDTELLGNGYFSPSTATNNPVKKVSMILPAGHKRNYPDSCALMLGFSQEHPEPDSLTENQIREILLFSFGQFAENSMVLNRRFLLHFEQDTVINLAAPEFIYENMASENAQQKMSQFAFGMLPVFNSLKPSRVTLCNLRKERKTVEGSVFLLLAFWQLITGCCFLIRYIFTGK